MAFKKLRPRTPAAKRMAAEAKHVGVPITDYMKDRQALLGEARRIGIDSSLMPDLSNQDLWEFIERRKEVLERRRKSAG